MPATKTERVPDYAISDDVKQILKIRRLLAKGIPQRMNMIRLQSSELKQMGGLLVVVLDVESRQYQIWVFHLILNLRNLQLSFFL